MDQNRRGEIALVLIKALARREGALKFGAIRQKLDKISDVTGISVEELKSFSELLRHELVVEEYLAENAK